MAPARQHPPPQFNKDEKVLCFHMDMLYEAKIMDVQPGEKPGEGYRYKVHYKGWKNTWDDWVLVDRIRPFDDEHKELAAQLHAQLKNSMQKSSKQPRKGLKNGGDSLRGSEERSSAAAQGGRGGRRAKDWELEQVSRLLFFHRQIPNTPCLYPLLLPSTRRAILALHSMPYQSPLLPAIDCTMCRLPPSSPREGQASKAGGNERAHFESSALEQGHDMQFAFPPFLCLLSPRFGLRRCANGGACL